MSNKPYSGLQMYLTHLKRKHRPFSCPHCQAVVLPRDFEKHSTNDHGIDSKSCCVWCFGKYTWSYRKRSQHADHLSLCSRSFLALNVKPQQINFHSNNQTNAAETKCIVSTSQPLRLAIMKEICPARDYFNHPSQYIDESLPDRALRNDFWLLETEPISLFNADSLNLAASYIQTFEKTQSTHEWHHIMVKAIAFKSFLETADLGVARFLKFSCWCDGGQYKLAKHRQHRHMIVVTPKGNFEGWFSKLQVDSNEKRPRGIYKCKTQEKIKTPLQLLNTLGYLSKRTSRSSITSKSTTISKIRRPLKEKHFYIFQALPVEFRKILGTQWSEGVSQVLYQEKLRHLKAGRLANETVLFFNDSKWRQKIGNVPDLDRNIVLPVAKHLSPTFIPTTNENYMYLTKDRPLYFEHDPDNASLDLNSWLKKQARLGNVFYNNVENEVWTPVPSVQGHLNNLMPLVNRIQHLESKLEDESAKNTHLNEKITSLKGEIVSLKADMDCQAIDNSQMREISNQK